MIIIRLWGGLGNQMFQYSYGYTLAKKINTEIRLDTSFYKKEPAILKLVITKRVVIDNKDLPYGAHFFKNRFVNKLIRVPSLVVIPIGNGFRYMKETRFKYSQAIANYNSNNTYLDGYWQCPQYFESEKDSLREQFRPRDNNSIEVMKLTNQIKKENSVAVHIRRGDYLYLKNRLFTKLLALGREYYEACLKHVNVTFDNPKIYFFTDDPEWVSQEYGDMANAVIVSGNFKFSDLEEMVLMSSCKHHVIANSTFSWWGAWLNLNEESHVWAPSRGFGNKDIVPVNWCQINVGKSN